MADTATKTYEDILYRVEDGVAVVTLNRPDKLNAWRDEMDRDVRAAMRVAADDPAVKVIILTGAGKGFCAGADMNMLQTIQSSDAGTSRSVINALEPWDKASNSNFQKQYSWFPAVQKPIIAGINGAAAGLGLIMSLYCDIRFAADTAKFTTAFSRRGLVAEHGISWLLPRLIGFANAADLLYSSRVIKADEAHRIGLISRVIPAADFERELMAYAKMLATEVSPRSLREMKREIWNAQFQSLGDAIEAANGDMPASFRSEDFKEGIAHFVEKRDPKFTGR
ncbi:MAG TPA: enoyl-CoA hydratase [Hyphomonadaceae bacterium]|nr:enoyl-CoA hydratase [Hyphomonadaceae bacterium]HPN05948.1 enoyl-CoA hydratase [Hyphomonadaceae bacterium]